MAGRLSKNNVDYFPHPAEHGRKMFYIENKYKNDGYAVWFKILEELGKANYHFLNLNEKTQIMFLSARCHISENLLIQIIDDLVELGEFNKSLWNVKILYNEKFVERIKKVYEKRNFDCLSLLNLIQHLKDLRLLKSNFRLLKGDGNTQSKVKESKVKNSKGISGDVDDKKTHTPNPSQEGNSKDEIKYFVHLLPDKFKQNGFMRHWKNWIDYRKEIKKPNTERSLKMQIKLLEQQPDPGKCINQSILKEWTTIYPVTDNNIEYGEADKINKAVELFLDDWQKYDLTFEFALAKYQTHKYFKQIKEKLKSDYNLTKDDFKKKYSEAIQKETA